MLTNTHISLLLCLLITFSTKVTNFPHDNVNAELFVIEKVVRGDARKSSTETLLALNSNDENNNSQEQLNAKPDNVDNESVMDTADDLIFLAKRPQQPATEVYQQIDLLTSAEEDTLASGASSISAEEQQTSKSNVNAAGAHDEIELRSRVNIATPSNQYQKPIDMSSFVALIPAAEVKAIAANYYRRDAEVQRAYAFLRSPYFGLLQQHVIQIPELSAFLRYLNNSGLDLVGFLRTLTHLTSQPINVATTVQTPNAVCNEHAFANDIDKTQHNAMTTEFANVLVAGVEATTAAATIATAPTITAETTTEEQLNGLHGLVDSILNILPQDQILATFFDKLETDEQFCKLVDSISNPAFAKILNNMQKSVALRNLILTLHFNGINITKIVDSLKAYFLLGK